MKIDKKLYLRFKDIPQNGKSSIYRSSIKVGEEKGVSVFELEEINSVFRLVFPVYIKDNEILNLDYTPEGYVNDFTMFWNMFVNGEIPAYIVSGNEICKGSDGEPILENVKIINKLKSKKQLSI